MNIAATHTPFSLQLLSIRASLFPSDPQQTQGDTRLLMQMDNVNFHLQPKLIYVCLFLSLCVWVPKMTNRLYTVERKMKQHKIPLGFESSNCSDETAAVLCCNQRNEYTIPIVTLTCNHARQFRTTRTP